LIPLGSSILVTYPLLLDNTCHFVVADFDDHSAGQTYSPLEDVIVFVSVCVEHGILYYVLRSKSGKGYHVFAFFTSAAPAHKRRVSR